MGAFRKNIDVNKSRFKNFSIFEHCSKDQFESIWKQASFYHYTKGSFIYNEGCKVNGIYIILDGVVKQIKGINHKKPQILRLVSKGETFGYRSLITDELACTTTQAITETKVCYIELKDFMQLLNNNTVLQKTFLQHIFSELEETQKHILNVAQKNVRARVALALVNLVNQFSQGESLDLRLSRFEFASLIGTVPETVTRIFSEFREDKLISIENKNIKVLNKPMLKHIGETCF